MVDGLGSHNHTHYFSKKCAHQRLHKIFSQNELSRTIHYLEFTFVDLIFHKKTYLNIYAISCTRVPTIFLHFYGALIILIHNFFFISYPSAAKKNHPNIVRNVLTCSYQIQLCLNLEFYVCFPLLRCIIPQPINIAPLVWLHTFL